MRQVWIAVTVVLLLAGISGWARHVIYQQGVAAEKADHEKAIAKLKADQEEEYKKHSAEVTALTAKLTKTRREDDAKLADALAKSEQTMDLWNTPLPPAMADHAWGDGLPDVR